MSQLRTHPPDWLATGDNDAATNQAKDLFQLHAETPNFSAKTKAHWTQVKETQQTAQEWYNKAEEWWSDPTKASATVDGVLGGFGELDPVDCQESKQFLVDIHTLLGIEPSATPTRALDGGAGIGRVAKHLLSEFYTKVDLVEGNQRLLDAAPDYMKRSEATAGGVGRVGGSESTALDHDKSQQLGELYCTTLQDFVPAANGYECIWVQWVIIYLTDVDLIEFLKRCAVGLKPSTGFIVIKENVLQTKYNSTEFILDEEDSSLTRSRPYMNWIFEQAGLEIFVETKQEHWHKSMLPVYMYCLRPASAPESKDSKGE